MSLRYIDTQEPWNGERIDGIRYARSIASKWTVAQLKKIGLEKVPPPDPVDPPASTRLHKTTIVRRMTNQEVTDMLAALDAHPDAKMAELYRATPTFDVTADEWPVMEAAFEAVLGEARAAEVLEPEF